MEEDANWEPVAVKIEPEFNEEEIDDPEFSAEAPETNSDVHLENRVFCSVSGVPLASGSTVSTEHDAPALTQRIKVENIEDEDENLSTDLYPETSSEVACTTLSETSSGVRLESSIFCSVSGLPLASGSAASIDVDAAALTPQIKVENIEDEDLSADAFHHDGSDRSSDAVSSPALRINSALSTELAPVKSEDEDSNCKETTSNLNFVDNYKNLEVGGSSTSVECTASDFDVQPLMFAARSKPGDGIVKTPSVNYVKFHTKKLSSPNSFKKSRSKGIVKDSIETNFPCKECGSRFKTKSMLNRHFLSHSDEKPFACEQCSARFKLKSHLTAHMRGYHSNDKPFSCDQCHARFKSKSELKKHAISHSDDRPFFCEHCPARFKKNKILKVHLRTHADDLVRMRPFACDQCSARFTATSHLANHVLAKHSDERPFSCEQCSARFKIKDQLNRHLSSHSDERPFSCTQCSARFKRKAHLMQHLHSHSGTKPFSCKECSTRFKTKGEVKTHSTIHSNERSFSCEQCSARFRLKHHLSAHLRSHSDERLFYCQRCHAGFKMRSDYTRHLNRRCPGLSQEEVDSVSEAAPD